MFNLVTFIIENISFADIDIIYKGLKVSKINFIEWEMVTFFIHVES